MMKSGKTIRLKIGNKERIINIESNISDEILIGRLFGSVFTDILSRDYDKDLKIINAFKIRENGSYVEIYPRDQELREKLNKNDLSNAKH